MSIVLTSRLTILAIVVVLFSPGVFGESAEPAGAPKTVSRSVTVSWAEISIVDVEVSIPAE